ncbi:MAG: hypothetical protein JXR31_14780, partial [Prolixibacteraceae bacterium]|nr:hypothetical protein [Prolixibacteraceae bacterium]
INGPTRNDNGALDYDSGFKLTGGFLIAVGCSGMAQAPASNSTQYSVKMNFRSSKTAGNLIHVESSGGKNIFTFKPVKSYQSVVFSSPKIEKGNSYDFYLGGTVTGETFNGLYLDQDYSGGNINNTFTVTAIVTSITAN